MRRESDAKVIAKNTFMLYLMSAATMLFPLIILPYLTRVLSVAKYGVYTYVKASLSYVVLVVEFGYIISATKDVALAQGNPKQLSRVFSEVVLAKLILSFMSLIAFTIMVCFIAILRENPLFSMLSFVSVVLNVLLPDYLFRGIDRMGVITKRFVTSKAISTILTFVFVHGDTTFIIIPILDILSSLVAVLLTWIEMKKIGVSFVACKIIQVAGRIKSGFPYFLSGFASTGFNAISTLLIGVYFSKENVAYWGVAMQIVLAAQALYTPLVNGIYPHMVRTKDISKIIWVLKVFMPLAFVGCLVVFVFSPSIMVFVGGKSYREASLVLRLLIPVVFLSFPSSLLGWPTLGAIDKVKETTSSTILAAVFQVSVLVLLVLSGRFTIIGVAIVRVIAEALMLLTRTYFTVKYFRRLK